MDKQVGRYEVSREEFFKFKLRKRDAIRRHSVAHRTPEEKQRLVFRKGGRVRSFKGHVPSADDIFKKKEISE